jgi:hypothetical protein
MSYPSSPISFSSSPARRMNTPSPTQDEKNCLLREINALKRKVEQREEVIQELNRTINREAFTSNPYEYVLKLKKESLTSSMDRIGQKVRSFFEKHKGFFNGTALIENSIENAIRERFTKIENMAQTILKLTKISCDPAFQKSPREYLTQWQKEHAQEVLINEKITEILNDSE